MWHREVRQRFRGDGVIGDLHVFASEHPYDGGGWRVLVSVEAPNRRVWVDAGSHGGEAVDVRFSGVDEALVRCAIESAF